MKQKGKLSGVIGKKYNRLTIIDRLEGSKHMFKCKCECGNEVVVNGYNVLRGNTKSCGCLKIETSRENAISSGTHGLIHTRLYRTWSGMKYRCYNKDSKDYDNYGGRGIKVSDEWVNDFLNFYNWSMDNGYNNKLTIDRINVNGNYEPNNCRWATLVEQGRNMRSNRMVDINGVVKTASEWIELSGINRNTFYWRLYNGWVGDKLLLPSRGKSNEKI